MGKTIDPPFSIDVDVLAGDVVAVRLHGDLDLASAHRVTEHVGLLVEQGFTRLIVDGTGLDFVDSTGLGALLEAHRAVHEHGSAFFLVPSEPLARVMEITGVIELLRVYPTVREAASVMRSEGAA